MEEKLYTYGPEEAKEIAQAENLRNIEKGSFSVKYADIPKAIAIMREWRRKKGLGNKVEILLKEEVKLRKTESMQKTFRTLICPYTKITFGKYRGMNPINQTPMWSAIELPPLRQFDLSSDDDAADWLILRLAPCIEDSSTSHKFYDTKYWIFNDVRANNANSVFKASEIVKVVNIVSGMTGSEMVNMARLLNMVIGPGDDMNLQLIDIKGFLLENAMADPVQFMSKYKDHNRALHELIHAALSMGMIQYSHTEGYSMMGNGIGRTLEEATGYLRSDKNLHSLLKGEVISNDILARRMEDEKPDEFTHKQALEKSLADASNLSNIETIE